MSVKRTKEVKAKDVRNTKPKIMIDGVPISKEEEKENQRAVDGKDIKKKEQSAAYDLMQLKMLTGQGTVSFVDGCMTGIIAVLTTVMFIVFSPLFMFRKEEE